MAKQVSRISIIVDIDPATGAPTSLKKVYGVADGDLRGGSHRPTVVDSPDFGQTVTAMALSVFNQVKTDEGIS